MNINTKKTQSQSLIIIISIVGFMMVVNLLFIYLSAQEKKTARLLRKELVTLEQNEKIIKSAQEMYSRYTKEIEIVSEVFPNEETLTLFVQDFEDVIRTSGSEYRLKFNSVIPLQEQDRLFLPITLRMRTDMENLIKLLDRLEKMPYMTHIASINTKAPNNFSGEGEVIISLKVYVQNPFTTK